MSTVRRSTRSNKGQHKRLEDENKEAEALYKKALEESSKRRKKPTKNSKAKRSNNTDEEDVRCLVCGVTEDDGQDMLQCDKCLSWEHSACVLQDPSKVPDIYQCYYCNPSDSYLKTLKYKLDANEYYANKKKQTSKPISDDDEDFQDQVNDEDKDDNKFSDNENDGEEEDNDDDEYSAPSKLNKRTRSAKNSSSSESTSTRKRSTAHVPKIESPKINQEEFKSKQRTSVMNAFERIFLNLLPGDEITSETDSVEEISKKWSKKLEEELFDAYHDKLTGKPLDEYIHGFKRISSNIKDKKNDKLRTSIINRSIPFHTLVRLSVKALLNPELRKEKEEAIKESMNQATLEIDARPMMRKTKKGDEIIENDEPSNNQPYDLNVGFSIDTNDKRFINSEANATYERSNSIFNSNSNQVDDDDDDDNNEIILENNNIEITEDSKNDPNLNILEEDDLDNILNDKNSNNANATTISNNNNNNNANNDTTNNYDNNNTNKKIESEEEAKLKQRKKEIEEDLELQNKPNVWEGQFVFTGITNFEANLKFISSTLTNSEFEKLLPHLLEPNIPLTVDGRLSSKKADPYIANASTVRRLILLELKPKDNLKGFVKLFDYFDSRKKYGVVLHKDKPFIKDIYLVPISDETPQFVRDGLHKKDIPGTKSDRLFLIYIIKPEFIKSLPDKEIKSMEYNPNDKSTTNSEQEVDSRELARTLFPALNSEELTLVLKIYNEFPETKKDTGLLIQYLQNALTPK